MSWNNVAEERFITSLISNSLTINSGGRSPATRRADSRARSTQRRANIAPLAMNFEDNSNSPEKPTTMSPDEMSFYTGNSPLGSPRPCSISPCMEIGMLSPGQRETENMDDYNSRDSGYGASQKKFRKLFDFVPPNGLPPKRLDTPSPPKMQTILAATPTSTSCFRSFNSLSSDSMESMDDECMDLLEMDDLDDNAQLPTSFNTIISGNIKSNSEVPLLRRCLSLTDGNVQRSKSESYDLQTVAQLKSIAENMSPFTSKITDSGSKAFKRPEPPSGLSPVQSKRLKSSICDDKENSNEIPAVRPVFRKSISMNDAIIMNALARSSTEPDLIGDFSKSFCLPLTDGRHNDLKSISADTMAKLLNGDYKSAVSSFKVIDCRYPYEFEGGHIQGAMNFYTHEQIMNELVNTKTETPQVVPEGPMRNIIVFHCEFSSERGPKLSRFLRNTDRTRNEHAYPALHYPEIYLLHGGYKEFFESYSELCDPISYRPMLDPSYNEAYRQFRAKSKSWAGDSKSVARSTRFVKTKSRNLIY